MFLYDDWEFNILGIYNYRKPGQLTDYFTTGSVTWLLRIIGFMSKGKKVAGEHDECIFLAIR